MTMCITVAGIQAQGGNKPSFVVTQTGARLKCFPDKIDKFGIEIGGTYNLEVSEYTNAHGTSLTIVKAKRVTTGLPAPREPFVSGLPDRPHHSAPPPAPAAFRTPEQMFVSEVICAYIAAGKCANPAELKATIAAIRAAYNGNWGGPNGNGTAYIHADPAPHMNGNGAAPH